MIWQALTHRCRDVLTFATRPLSILGYRNARTAVGVHKYRACVCSRESAAYSALHTTVVVLSNFVSQPTRHAGDHCATLAMFPGECRRRDKSLA